MINTHRKLLAQLTKDEYWLFVHIAKYMNKDNFCFPGRDRLMKDTGFSVNVYTRTLKSLDKKGFISRKQQIKKGGKFGSNGFKITTDLIGVYVSLNGVEQEEEKPCHKFSYTGSIQPCHISPYTVAPYTAKYDTKYCKYLSLSIVKKNISIVNTQGAREKTFSIDDFNQLYELNPSATINNHWYKLTQAEKQKIGEHLPTYLKYNPEERFRKSPLNYIRGKAWNEKLIDRRGKGVLKSTPSNVPTQSAQKSAPKAELTESEKIALAEKIAAAKKSMRATA